MRKANDKPIKEAIEQMFNVYKLKRKFDETHVVAAWPDFVGKPLANRTKELYIYNKKLFVRVESSVIKNELVLMRNQIIDKINEGADGVVIEEIIFL